MKFINQNIKIKVFLSQELPKVCESKYIKIISSLRTLSGICDSKCITNVSSSDFEARKIVSRIGLESFSLKFNKTKLTLILKSLRLTMLFGLMLLVNTAKAQSLDTLLQQVVNHNPELKSLQLEYEAELLKKDQVSQLSNPEVGVGVPILKPETRLGPQVVLVSINQMFPWFGTLKSKENVVVAMSKAKYERISALKLDLFNQIKVAYYQIYFLYEKIEIINGFIEIFKTIESVALAKVESGQSTTADVLRIQLKLQEFNQELNIIENQKLKYSAVINQLTHQTAETIIQPADIFDNPALLNFDIEAYKLKIQNHHPLILKIDQQIEVSKQQQVVNSNINKPKIGVGIDYSLVNPRTDANPTNNGQDILVPKVKVSVPLYRKSYNAKNQQEEKYQESLNLQKQSLEDKMISLLLQYKSAYDNAILKIELNHQQIETTKMAYEVLLANYSSNGKGFDDLLQIQNQLLGYQLALKKQKITTYIMVANIDRLTDY
jgi:outer membrane protein TolC